MAKNIRNIQSAAELEALVRASGKPVILDFWAPWCGPCKALGPILEDTANALGNNAIIAKVNIDENTELARTHNIASIPTLVYYSEGEAKHRQTGIASKETIIKQVNQLTAQAV